MLASALLAGDFIHGLAYAVVLVPTSSLAAILAAAAARRRDPNLVS
jgi:hypothetical protein